MGCPTVFIGDDGGSPGGNGAAADEVDEAAEQTEMQNQARSSEAALVDAAATGVALVKICPACAQIRQATDEPKSTFVLRVVDDQTDEPARGVALKITLPNGNKETHTTDENGQVIIDDLDHPGVCEVTCELDDAEAERTFDIVRRE